MLCICVNNLVDIIILEGEGIDVTTHGCTHAHIEEEGGEGRRGGGGGGGGEGGGREMKYRMLGRESC